MSNVKQYFTKRNVLFVVIFAVLGFIALQIPIAQFEGSKAKFMVYDAFAPVAGAFIGVLPGVLAVFFMQFINFLVHGAVIEDAGTIIRFLPMLFVVLYFAKKGKFNLVIPIIAILAFIAHPIGRTVWYFSLIPVVVLERALFAIGISVSFVLVNNLLAFLQKKHILNLGFNIEGKYLLSAFHHEPNTQ